MISQTILGTRRYLGVLVDVHHLVVMCETSTICTSQSSKLFNQLTAMLKFYSSFEINDFTGKELTDAEMVEQHYSFFASLQVRASVCQSYDKSHLLN